ncbi:hypothetical protein [Methylobacterium sp. J-059]|uniref:hypothetical protein n=1 Tax=Methylobacterium sp. J-059 TaxID=2836643 RepID=UPI001FBAAFBB|nr:hypothetical protein [Methylobacterium sp. J-059]
MKRRPSTGPKPTLRERFAAMRAKVAGLNAGKDRQSDPAGSLAASVPLSAAAAVPIAIDRHMRAYAERLYAEAYGTADAGTRAEQERDAFRALLHTPLASDAERLAYATAIIARAAGVYGLECRGSTCAAWMPTAYRNLAFGEYAPEHDMAGHQPTAADTPSASASSLASEAEISSTNVEAELTALVAKYQGFARVSDEAMAREDDAGLPLSDDLDNAIDRVRHFTNLGREDTVRHAMALPATTLLGFGLKAQILEHDAGAAWDGSEADADIVRCRALLHGLIAAAGLSPIPQLDVTSDEVRGWLAAPETAPGASRMKA